MVIPITELLILVATVCAGISGIVITRNLYSSSPIHTKERNRIKEYMADLEKENRSLKAKVKSGLRKVRINEYDEDRPESAIGDLIAGLEPLLPDSVKPLLRNTGLISQVEKYAKENPEVVNQILQKLVKKTSGGKTENAPTNETFSV